MGLARPTPRPYSEWGVEGGEEGEEGAYTIETEKWALSLREQVCCSLTMMMGGPGFRQSGGFVVIFHPFASMSHDAIFTFPTALFRGVK